MFGRSRAGIYMSPVCGENDDGGQLAPPKMPGRIRIPLASGATHMFSCGTNPSLRLIVAPVTASIT